MRVRAAPSSRDERRSDLKTFGLTSLDIKQLAALSRPFDSGDRLPRACRTEHLVGDGASWQRLGTLNTEAAARRLLPSERQFEHMQIDALNKAELAAKSS